MFVPRRIAIWVKKLLPQPLVAKLNTAYTGHHRRTVERLNRAWLHQLIVHHPATVQTGPFRGMRYGDAGLPGETVARWLGAYELELHPLVESLCGRAYAQVINIGCAEGYYAVGLARRLPQAQVKAFDIDTVAVGQCRRLAAVNGVADRLTVEGRCTVAGLNDLVRGATLIVCDCEGAELELLDPLRVPRLAEADLLVEVHDFVDPAISQTLSSRFAATHTLTRIRSGDHAPAAYPQLAPLRPKDRALALNEFRPGPMEWFWVEHRGN
jgi:hypothetical protein